MVVKEEFGIIWGCAQINETVHDEALIIFGWWKFLFNKKQQEIKHSALDLLENKSFISGADLLTSMQMKKIKGIISDPEEICSKLKCVVKSSYFFIGIIIGFGCVVIMFITKR